MSRVKIILRMLKGLVNRVVMSDGMASVNALNFK